MPVMDKRLFCILMLFLLSSALFKAKAQHWMSNKEVYDFEPGNIFEYTVRNGNDGALERDSVVSRRYSANADTLIYEVQVTVEHLDPGGNQVWRSVEVVKYDSPDSQVVPGVHIDHRSKADTTKEGSQIDSMWVDLDFKNRISNSEYTQDANHFEPSSKSVTYTAGLGISFMATESAEGGSARQLYYYKKGAESVGTSRFTEISESVGELQAMHMYPNPVSSQGNIFLSGTPEGNIKISIYDLQGRLISLQQLFPAGPGALCIPLHNSYSPGVYILQLNAAGGRSFKDKFFITP